MKRIVVVSLGLGLVNLGLAPSVPAQSQTDAVVTPITVTGSGEPLTLAQAVEIALAKNPLMRVTAGGRQLVNFRAGLSVRVPVLDQRQSQARIDLARLGQQRADQQTELVGQQIRFDVLKSYYGVLLAESKVVVDLWGGVRNMPFRR